MLITKSIFETWNYLPRTYIEFDQSLRKNQEKKYIQSYCHILRTKAVNNKVSSPMQFHTMTQQLSHTASPFFLLFSTVYSIIGILPYCPQVGCSEDCNQQLSKQKWNGIKLRYVSCCKYNVANRTQFLTKISGFSFNGRLEKLD